MQLDGKDVLAVHRKDLVTQIESLLRVLLKEVESNAVALDESYLTPVSSRFAKAA